MQERDDIVEEEANNDRLSLLIQAMDKERVVMLRRPGTVSAKGNG